MKKFLFLFLATVLVFVFSCQKKEAVNLPQQQSLVFSVNHVNPDVGLKATLPCIDEDPNYAWVVINGTYYYPTVYQLDGKWYTQSIKLDVNPPPTFTVTKFSLWHDTGTGIPTGSQTPMDKGAHLVMATPNTGAEYSEYVTKPTPFTIPVTAFEKAQVPVEVLCFQAADYSNFGFDWFAISRTVIREFCFFGDICLNGDPYSPADYLNSLYDVPQLPAGTQPDMPAIIKMHVFKDGTEVPNSPFTNATTDASYGVGSPLCVQYPDNLDADGEVFTFELYILVKNAGGSFSYQPYYTFTSTDDGALIDQDNNPVPDNGGDGVVDFVLGTCNSSETDLQLAWLPQITAVTVYPGDLANDLQDVMSDPSKWFYYDDGVDGSGNDRGIFAPDANNSFFSGPGFPPAGTGSAQIYVPVGTFAPPSTSRNPQYALTTRQFAGILLTNITEMKYSVYYDPSNSLPRPVINFNVSFDGNDTWQGRLTYTPPTNTLTTATWVEYDALTEGTWRWSGKNIWPAPNTWTGGKSWNDVTGYYPNAKMRINDSWFGFRVDDSNSGDNTQHVDKAVFGVNGTSITYDFEP